MKKFASTLCWLLLAILLFAISIAWSLYQDTSLFNALILWLSALAALVLFRLALALVIMLRKNQRLRHFLATFNHSPKIYLLHEHWRGGAKILQRLNRLRPTMPWFIMMGRRNGKTTLLDSTQLPILSHNTTVERVVPTRTLKWWFFKKLCVLDISSHYSTAKPGTARAWQQMMLWGKKLRAPKAVLITVSCEDLASQSATELHHYGRDMRIQLEQLLKAYNSALPIHIVITKTDTLPGFSDWLDTLTPAQRTHALGYRWQHSPVIDRKAPFLQPLFDTLKQGMNLQSISVLNGEMPAPVTHRRMVFSDELQQLCDPLTHFIVALCEPDPYHATGMLKGVWFSATVPNPQSLNQRTGLFSRELLIKQLLKGDIREKPERLNRQHRKLSLSLSTWLTCVFCIGLIWSGWQTHLLLGSTAARDSATPAQRLYQLEKGFQQPWRYLPYIPLMNYWHARTEKSLLVKPDWQLNRSDETLAFAQESFEEGAAEEKRELILQLSSALLLQEAMLRNQSLVSLPTMDNTGDFLPLSFNGRMPEMARKATLRVWMRSHAEQIDLVKQRALLASWVNGDPEWRWLIEGYPAIQPAYATTPSKFDESGPTLNSIWTRKGEQQLQRDTHLIEQALHDSQKNSFLTFWQQWPQQRQSAWLAWLSDSSEHMLKKPVTRLSANELVAIGNGTDSTSQFIRSAVSELETISSDETQPWLMAMRRVAQVQQQTLIAGLAAKASHHEQRLRHWVYRQMGHPRGERYLTAQDYALWENWQKSLASAVNVSLKPRELALLTSALFSLKSPENAQPNPLEELNASFVALREQMMANTKGQGEAIVWDLMQSRLQALTGNALSHTACQLEEQWQHQVLQPLGAPRLRKDAERQEEMAWQLFQHFLQTRVAPFLTPGGSGLQPAQWQHYQLPFTTEFLFVVNHAQRPEDLQSLPVREETQKKDRLAALEKQLAALKKTQTKMMKTASDSHITTLPSTVPGGAALLPTGTRLHLICENQSYTLSSVNLREEGVFRWAPGQCNYASVTVLFQQSELVREFVGHDAWPRLLEEFAEDEHLYQLDDFKSHDADKISQQGANKILVRFKFQRSEQIQQTWRRWQELELMREELEARIADIQASLDTQTNYFTGNMTALPSAVLHCRR